MTGSPFTGRTKANKVRLANYPAIVVSSVKSTTFTGSCFAILYRKDNPCKVSDDHYVECQLSIVGFSQNSSTETATALMMANKQAVLFSVF